MRRADLRRQQASQRVIELADLFGDVVGGWRRFAAAECRVCRNVRTESDRGLVDRTKDALNRLDDKLEPTEEEYAGNGPVGDTSSAFLEGQRADEQPIN